MTADARSSASTATETPQHAGAGAVAGGLVALSLAAIGLMALIGEVIPPVAVLVVLFLATAAMLLRSSRSWVRWAAVVLPLVLVAANLPFAVADLSHPESTGGFVPTLVIISVALATAGLAVRHARGSSVPSRGVWAGTVGLVVLGTGLSLVLAGGLQDDAAAAGDTELQVADATYPERVEVADGAGVLVDNTDPFRHTFVVEGTDVAVEVPAGTARRVALDIAPGEYPYLCDVPGHESMQGTLVVE